LKQVIEALPVEESAVLSRCTICNTLLVPVDSSEAEKHVPPKVFERQTRFWFCPSCQKYYWMGTHYEDMEKRIAVLLREKKGSV